jgi:hypothetical protein
MIGQWLGQYSGTNNGLILVDLEEHGGMYVGYGILTTNDGVMPETYVEFVLQAGQTAYEFTANPAPVDPATRNPITWDLLKGRFPGVDFPTTANVKLAFNGDELEISWRTSLGSEGSAKIEKSKASKPSELVPVEISTWNEFSEHVKGLPAGQFIFRGQQSSLWRLRTSFHRTGRVDLKRYNLEDIPALHQQLTAQTKHVFDIRDDIQFGAFVSLIQHHGYPTPLLDWTFSPFVAAFFAYRGIKNSEAINSSNKVRIFQFAKNTWSQLPQLLKLAPCAPHLSLLAAIAIENPRMVPQQALSSVTNVDDVEPYIKLVEKIRNNTYLQVIDLPVRDRPSIMRELAMMGITAGSLLPGLDGTCEALKEKHFSL